MATAAVRGFVMIVSRFGGKPDLKRATEREELAPAPGSSGGRTLGTEPEKETGRGEGEGRDVDADSPRWHWL